MKPSSQLGVRAKNRVILGWIPAEWGDSRCTKWGMSYLRSGGSSPSRNDGKKEFSSMLCWFICRWTRVSRDGDWVPWIRRFSSPTGQKKIPWLERLGMTLRDDTIRTSAHDITMKIHEILMRIVEEAFPAPAEENSETDWSRPGNLRWFHGN